MGYELSFTYDNVCPEQLSETAVVALCLSSDVPKNNGGSATQGRIKIDQIRTVFNMLNSMRSRSKSER